MTDPTALPLDKRSLLAGAGALALAAALPVGLAPSPARAAAPLAGAQVPGAYRYKVGSIEVTAISDGGWNRPLDDGFVKNAPRAAVEAALTEAFLPTAAIPIPFTTLVVNTGTRLVLIDTGTGGLLAPTAGTMTAGLAAAGIDPKLVDTVVISHFHADHINGLRPKEGLATFPNAQVMVPEAEWAFWTDEARAAAAPEGMRGGFANVKRVFGPMKDVARYGWDKEVVPGITAIRADGHTPGHTAFVVASGDAKLLVLSDTTNHPALFVRNPDWSAVFDMDADAARATRRRLLDMAASERMQVAGYHFPFPATGMIAREGAGYRLVPTQWMPLG